LVHGKRPTGRATAKNQKSFCFFFFRKRRVFLCAFRNAMSVDFDCAVIGAGVVGLATARAMALRGQSVLVLEEQPAIGTITSARNSGVMHAGLYYPAGSWRARLCVSGRRALYDFCATHAVDARACGKLVVACEDAEIPALHALAARAEANGVEDLRLLSAAEARAMEPSLRCLAALWSPVTGIVDAHGLMLALLGEAQDQGAVLAVNAKVSRIRRDGGSFVMETADAEVSVRRVINAAGHGACAVARRIDGLDTALVPPAYLSKGSYFTLSGRSPFSRLIYPMPIPGGAGVHLTLDLGGQARFGPDVEAVEDFDYRVDPARGQAFYAAIRRYWPGLPDDALQPGYAGIRPKIVPADQAQDFVIQGPDTHGIAGLVNLFGIESPGLTSCLAIADEAASMALAA
jgi:L-2-hydroxyglutarate oxidase LhgO